MSAPRLDDPRLYQCRAGIPLLDTHTRGGRVVDRARLDLIVRNSNERAARGELGLMLLGHTTEDGKESDQPPVVGYAKNYRLGVHNGRDCIMGDLYYDAADAQRLMKNFPRRSVEVSYSDRDPKQNYLDGVALLVRAPARELGLVTYASGKVLERYSMADAANDPEADLETRMMAGISIPDIPDLIDWMKAKGITDTAQGVKGFLNARASGRLEGDLAAFGKDDIEGITQYCQRNKVDINKPGAYAAALERYKAEKKEAAIERYRKT